MPSLIAHITSRVPRQTWHVAGTICPLAAIAFWWIGQREAAFVAGVLGIVSWFLNFRLQLEEQNNETDAARAHRNDEDKFDDRDEGIEDDV